MTTATFDESIFPHVFECKDCPHESRVVITHEEATDAVPIGVNATPRQAVNRVLKSRGWRKKGGRRLCQKCMEDLD